MYVGNSSKQGHAVPQVLNLDTGAITYRAQSTINFDNDDWYKTFGLTEWQYVPYKLDDSPNPVEPSVDTEQANQREHLQLVMHRLTHSDSWTQQDQVLTLWTLLVRRPEVRTAVVRITQVWNKRNQLMPRQFGSHFSHTQFRGSPLEVVATQIDKSNSTTSTLNGSHLVITSPMGPVNRGSQLRNRLYEAGKIVDEMSWSKKENTLLN